MIQDDEVKKLRHKHAWSRFLARYIDVFLFSILFWVVLALISAHLFEESSSDNLDIVANIAMLFSWVIVETILLTIVGTTIGKYLFNITLRDREGQKLTLRCAFRRSFMVFIFGLCAGLPLFSLITLVYSYLAFKKDGITKWDKENECQIMYGKIGVFRVSIIILLLITTVSLIIYNAYTAFSSSI